MNSNPAPVRGLRCDISTVNLTLLAAVRQNAFWDHDMSPLRADAASDRFAYQCTRLLQQVIGAGDSASVARSLHHVAGMLHRAATDAIAVEGSQYAFNFLTGAGHYVCSPTDSENPFFGAEHSILSNVTALRHIADAVRSLGGWQWIYKELKVSGAGVASAPRSQESMQVA